jgi:hypothetical protein
MIRDNALAVSGLLNRKIGGESVRPYQPPGLWEAVSFSKDFSSQSYEQSKGQDLYRRGLYVYIKRSMPYPPLTTFDAPNREVCTPTSPNEHTAQALVLLNDPLSKPRARSPKNHEGRRRRTSTRLAYAFRLTLARQPTKNEGSSEFTTSSSRTSNRTKKRPKDYSVSANHQSQNLDGELAAGRPWQHPVEFG